MFPPLTDVRPDPFSVSHVTNFVSNRGGGVTPAVRGLVEAIAADGACRVSVLALRDETSTEAPPQWDGVSMTLQPSIGPAAYQYSPGLSASLQQQDASLLHRHCLWTHPSRSVYKVSRQRDIPYVVTPHGMLNKVALAVSSTRKKWMGRIFENRFLRAAGAIHVLTKTEAQACREYGLSNPLAVIPNGVQAAVEAPGHDPPWQRDERRVLLYLGRIHPIKGLRSLIQGMVDVGASFPDWKLVVAGWEQDGHQAELEAICEDAPGRPAIEFVGPQFGLDKAAALTHCSAFVLPSTGEALPVAALEAFSYGKAVLATDTCNLDPALISKAGFEVPCRPEGIIEGLQRLFRCDEATLAAMGAAGKLTIESDYRWTNQAGKMIDVYRWLLGDGKRPGCVMF